MHKDVQPPSTQSASRQKQVWKNVSRYWLIPHFLLQAALLQIAQTTHYKTLDASQHDRPVTIGVNI